MGAHRLGLRVYYEDTDLAGVVYYANYLRFYERGRTEALRAGGIDQGRLKAEAGLVFVVRAVAVDYLVPAVFDDWLEVVTGPVRTGGARVLLSQRIERSGAVLSRAEVTLAAMDARGRPARLPPEVRAVLEALTAA